MTALTISHRDRYRISISEDGMAATIKQAVELRGGRCFHVRDSRGQDVADLPDLVCVDPASRTVYLVELKSQGRVVTPGQRHVLELIGETVQVWGGVVRPAPKHPGEVSYDGFLRLIGVGS